MYTSLIRITEIFYSLQGESSLAGIPTIFIRLTGCPLRCQYCDTSYAFKGGVRYTISDILSHIEQYPCKIVCVTGGEPLAQPACKGLLAALCDKGYGVSLETSGAIDISAVDSRATIIMDLKTPDSKECHQNLYANIEYLKPNDEVKFVICSRADYDWARHIIAQYQLVKKAQILFSPSWGQVEPTLLADWILMDNLPVRFQLQLHKVLWKDAQGR